MKGPLHATGRRITALALATIVISASNVMPAMAAGAGVLAACDGATGGDGAIVSPWTAILDSDGEVVEHRMTIRRDGIDHTLEYGWRGFFADIDATRVLVGERSDEGTSLTLLAVPGACRIWDRSLEQLAYDITPQPEVGAIQVALHEPTTRLHEGFMIIDLDSGVTQSVIGGQCGSSCEPNDGDVPPSAFAPAAMPRPVPSFAAGAWPRDHALPFSWQSGAKPPAWAKWALKAGADDTIRTSKARSPHFDFDPSAGDKFRYTPIFPTFCRFGIACASRAMPTWWAVWIRPHGTDFSWGRLRWCQRQDAHGCFDLRRVAIHELGHVSGLDHPSNAGFRLPAHETIMHAITPARPSAGSSRHAYGRCDVATLQELYDVPGKQTLISTCHNLVTTLTLSADASVVDRGRSVRFTAVLRVADRSAYGRLADNALAGRSVRLRFRRAGNNDGWSSTWMESVPGTARYTATISPQSTWEFKATFPAPDDEGLRFSSSDVLKVRVRD